MTIGYLVPFLLLLLGLAYLYPGSRALVTGSTTQMLGADGDVRALPYLYDQYHQTFLKHPSNFLYGAVFVETGVDAERGLVAWVPWVERWSVVALRSVLPIEQVTTGFVLLMMIADGLAMFAFARASFGGREGTDAVATALAIGWAFSAYTVARAQVHPAFVGVYHLPLIFWGLTLAARTAPSKGRRTVMAAAACFLGSVTVAHYYVVTAAALSPLFMLYFLRQPGVVGRRRAALGRLAVAIAPAILFLLWNVTNPLPPRARSRAADAFPATGRLEPGQTYHPYLRIFGAHPLDYLAADLWPGTGDVNPARAVVNDAVQADIARGGRGNPQERTNGVRWSVLALALVGLVTAFRRTSSATRSDTLFFAALAGFGFWLSLAPPVDAPWLGLSYWMQRGVAQLRVPSRAGIIVNFGCLVVAGSVVAAFVADRRRAVWAWAFPLVLLIDYPPFANPPRMTQVPPAIAELARGRGACGAGLFFPFASPLAAETEYLNFLLLVRGSDCSILNVGRNEARTEWFNEHFAPTPRTVDHLEPDARTTRDLIKIARCLPLTWIVFDDRTPAAWRSQTCAALGWTLGADAACVSPRRGEALRTEPDAC